MQLFPEKDDYSEHYMPHKLGEMKMARFFIISSNMLLYWIKICTR